MQKSVFIVVGILGLLLFADYFYFKDVRNVTDRFAVSEAFFRKGKLGDILKENALIKVSAGTEVLATNDLCAAEDSIKGYDYHNTYRLRFKMHASGLENVKIRIFFPKTKRYREVLAILNLQPGRHFIPLILSRIRIKTFKLLLRLSKAIK